MSFVVKDIDVVRLVMVSKIFLEKDTFLDLIARLSALRVISRAMGAMKRSAPLRLRQTRRMMTYQMAYCICKDLFCKEGL